jgi:arginase
MARRLAVVGVPSGAGACGVGQEQTPIAMRRAGLIGLLGDVGFETSDLGDSPVVRWHPDRVRPRAENLSEVVEVVRSTTSRVADALGDRDQTVLVLGGDCTVGIGTIAGVRAAVGDVAVVYFDLHSDLNTPASARDGALDWMALAHMLALEGSEPALVAAAGPVPLLEASQVVLFAHSQSDATRIERGEIERLELSRIALEEVRADPEAAARHALALVAARSNRYVIHLDVDVVRASVAQHGAEVERDAQRTEDPYLGSRPRRAHARRTKSPQRRIRRRTAGTLRILLCQRTRRHSYGSELTIRELTIRRHEPSCQAEGTRKERTEIGPAQGRGRDRTLRHRCEEAGWPWSSTTAVPLPDSS